MKSRIEIYSLLVCFCAVMCLMISAGIFGHAIFKMTAPQLSMESYEYNQYQNNDVFWKNKLSSGSTSEEKETTRVKPDEDELTHQRLNMFESAIQSEKRDGLQSMIQALIFIISACVVLVVHAMIAIKSRQE